MSDSPLPQNRPLQESDLVALIKAGAREDRFLEFKSDYLPQTDSGKRKFLQSVTAFANSHGGDLILGMAETDGIASSLVPLMNLDPDQSRLQILDLIRVHVRPTLGAVEIEPVSLSGGGLVLVVRVPKSWAGPHILNYGDDRRFYIRHDGGKRPMEYEEIRDGFLGGETTGARLRNYRTERCAAILNDEIPRQLIHPSRIVVHLVPFESLTVARRFEPRDLILRCDKLRPLSGSGSGLSFDVDGIYSYAREKEDAVHGYATLFRSGVIEAVDALWLSPWRDGTPKVIPYASTELKIIKAVESYLEQLASLNVPPPYAFFLSLLHVRGYFMPTEPQHMHPGNPINRDHLFIPEVILNAVPKSVASALFPAFNSVWNACGWPQSLNYDIDGNWKPTR